MSTSSPAAPAIDGHDRVGAPHPDAENPQQRARRLLPGWRRPALMAVLLVVALLLGRAARPEGASLALVWPAAAVAFLWLGSSWRSRRATAVDVLLVAALVVGVNLLTGATPLMAFFFAAANLTGARVSCVVMSRTPADSWRLRTPADLRALSVAAVAGAAGSALVGASAAWATGTDRSAEALAIGVTGWFLRNAVSTVVVAALVLRLLDAAVRRERAVAPAHAGPVELVASAAAAAAVLGVVFGTDVAGTWVFVVLPVSVWVGLRWTTTAASLHVLLLGAVVVVTTVRDEGPFAAFPAGEAVVVAQAFIGLAGVTTLLLALHRDEREALVASVRAARAALAEEAALLDVVARTTTDGLSVYDAEGTTLLRNPASVRLLPAPEDRSMAAWDGFYVFRDVDGAPVAEDRLPVARALAGEGVEQEDLVVVTPDGRERVLSVNAQPLPGAEGTRWGGGAVAVYRDVTAAHREAREVRRRRDLLSGVLDATTHQVVLALDLQGRVTVANNGATVVTGWPMQRLLGRSAAELLLPEDEGRDPLAVLGTRGPGSTEQRQWVRHDGRRITVAVTTGLLRDPGGAVEGHVLVATDVTQALAAERALADSEQLFRLSFDTAPTGMLVVGLEGAEKGRVRQVNAALSTLLDRDDLLGRAVDELLLDEAEASACAATVEELATGASDRVSCEYRLRHADAREVVAVLSAVVVRPRGGAAPYLLVVVEDVTAQRRVEGELRRQALHDGLTGLPNRALLRERLAEALAAAPRHGGEVALLYVDLDGFKAVNDGAGHAAGDALLVEVARRMTATVRPDDVVSRLGGDEFAVLCPATGGRADVAALARRLVAVVAEPVLLDSGVQRVGASIGAVVPDPGSTVDAVLVAADHAMYAAKRGGKGRAVLVPPEVPTPRTA